MNREIRGIITALNSVTSILLSELVLRFIFDDMSMVRNIIIFIALGICFYKALTDIEDYIIWKGEMTRNGKKDRRPERKGDKEDFQGIPWYEMRYPKPFKGDRNRRSNIKKV